MQLGSEEFQAIGVAIAAVLAGIGLRIGNQKGDGKAPEQRPPSPHEMREAIADLRRVIEGMRESLENHDDDHRQFGRQLDRIETRLQITNEVQSWRDRTVPPQR